MSTGNKKIKDIDLFSKYWSIYTESLYFDYPTLVSNKMLLPYKIVSKVALGLRFDKMQTGGQFCLYLLPSLNVLQTEYSTVLTRVSIIKIMLCSLSKLGHVDRF